jgi:sulfate adenylyltransferase
MSKKSCILNIDYDNWLEISNISNGVFAPLEGFMGSKDYHNVVENMHLSEGHPWTIPITLAVLKEQVKNVIKSETLFLQNDQEELVAELEVEDVFTVSLENDIKKIFGTDDLKHPGAAKESNRSKYRVGGVIKIRKDRPSEFSDIDYTPVQTRAIFKNNGWKSIVGFQTRNPLHRAHEYLQRVAMEIADGIFIQPLLGWKKNGDFTPLAVVKAYEKMIQEYYPSKSVLLGTLLTPMRYAGPREAVFHAIVRKNYGCTHFIVGRDHAGVGNYYGMYAAHELCKEIKNLGIEILYLKGPYYCKKCEGIVTEKTCSHDNRFISEISGTQVRAMLSKNVRPPENYMRPAISDTLIELSNNNQLFIEG